MSIDLLNSSHTPMYRTRRIVNYMLVFRPACFAATAGTFSLVGWIFGRQGVGNGESRSAHHAVIGIRTSTKYAPVNGGAELSLERRCCDKSVSCEIRIR